MNNLQLGKMYLVKELFWLLYPTKELAWWPSNVPGAVGDEQLSLAEAVSSAKYFSRHYQCNICVIEENTCFVLLEQDKTYYKLLDSNGNIGWIWCYAFSNHFELIKDLC